MRARPLCLLRYGQVSTYLSTEGGPHTHTLSLSVSPRYRFVGAGYFCREWMPPMAPHEDDDDADDDDTSAPRACVLRGKALSWLAGRISKSPSSAHVAHTRRPICHPPCGCNAAAFSTDAVQGARCRLRGAPRQRPGTLPACAPSRAQRRPRSSNKCVCVLGESVSGASGPQCLRKGPPSWAPSI